MKKLEITESSNYILAVSDEEIKENDVYLDDTSTLRKSITSNKEYWKSRNGYKKIIAYQPKDNALELDLPLLPEIVVEDEKSFIEKGKKHWDLPVLEKFEGGKIKSSTLKELIDAVIENTWEQCKRFLSNRAIEDDVEKLANEFCVRHFTEAGKLVSSAFISGYKTATKTYSEDDLRGAITKAYLVGVERSNYGKQLEDDIIQSIKQPKTPKWFVAETEIGYATKEKVEQGFIYEEELKTTTINGKTYLVGTYLYE